MLFEGHLLAYNPTYNVAEWVTVRGTVADLSPAEDSLAQELSNITLLEVPDDVPRMEQFSEWCMRPTPVAVPHAETGTWEKETGWDSLLAEGGTDVRLVECCVDAP